MYFYVEVFTVPAMQDVLTVGTPQNTAVQNPAVFKAVGQTTDVNAAPFSKRIDSHLHLPVTLYQNLSVGIGIHVFLAFAKIHRLCDILQNKMLRMLLPVVLVII